jgi:hypothetical protein
MLGEKDLTHAGRAQQPENDVARELRTVGEWRGLTIPTQQPDITSPASLTEVVRLISGPTGGYAGGRTQGERQGTTDTAASAFLLISFLKRLAPLAV